MNCSPLSFRQPAKFGTPNPASVRCLLSLLLLPWLAAAQQKVVWREDFESDWWWDNWFMEGGVWEVGKPTGGPKKAFSGQNCAVTGLAGKYPAKADARLGSVPFLVPAADQHPRFRFFHWYSIGRGDQGTVEVRVGQGAWKVVSQTNVWDGSGWGQGSVDLRAYAGQEVQVAFHFKASSPSEGPGWYVDDVAISTDVLPRLGDQTVAEGVLLAVPIIAKGSGWVFGLGQGAPEGAAIDPLFGLFTWVPSELQGPTTNSITVYVSTPNNPLERIDSATFTVVVNEVNAPPLVGSIGPKAIKADTLLRFPVTAIDPDWPTNRLVFTLDPGAPEGGAIDPTTGVFTWTPTAAQAATNHSITVRVTDNGTSGGGADPRSSVATFVALPKVTPTRLTAELTPESKVLVTVEDMIPGVDYALQISKDLIEWKALRTIRSETATFTHEDADIGSEPMRFYRLRIP